jgi:hypothetical protein
MSGKPTIVAAAMIYKGNLATLPAPNRHGDIIHAIAQKIPETQWPVSGLGGFLTSEQRFVDRKEGMLVAKAAGQVSQDHQSDTLYTEDLW